MGSSQLAGQPADSNASDWLGTVAGLRRLSEGWQALVPAPPLSVVGALPYALQKRVRRLAQGVELRSRFEDLGDVSGWCSICRS